MLFPMAGRAILDTVDTSFGSDRNGLVWGYVFRPGRLPAPVEADGAGQLLARPDDQQWFLWLHFSLSNAATERWLRHHAGLPESFLTGLRESGASTRLEQDGSALIAVIHDVLFDFGFDAADVATAFLCVGPRMLVSARPRPLRSLDRLRGAVKAGRMFDSPVDLLAHLLQEQANVLVEIVRKSTERVDAIEDALLANRISFSRAELSALRRMLVRLQRLLAPEPAALFRLLGRPPGWIAEPQLQNLRQSAEEFSAVVTDCAALGERIRLVQEELAARIGEQSNRILFFLTLVTVLAVPFNLIGGMFGMNVDGIPLAGHPHGFAIIVAGVAACTAVAAWLALRRPWRW
jgi:zinc transporter